MFVHSETAHAPGKDSSDHGEYAIAESSTDSLDIDGECGVGVPAG